MTTKNQIQILLGVLTLIGIIATAVFDNWDKLVSVRERDEDLSAERNVETIKPSASQSITANSNIQVNVNGSNNVVSSSIQQSLGPKACRDKSHGVESFGHTFEVERNSAWMGGGSDQQKWCSQVISELRGQYPDGLFEVISSSERSESKCSPFNCPQYMYFCTVRVKDDPIYREKMSSACL